VIFSDQDWIWIFIFEKNWIRAGSGYWFDFCYEIFLRVIQDFTNDGGYGLLWFLYSQCVLHSPQSMEIRVPLSLIFSSQVEVVSWSYIVGMLLCLLC